MFDKFILSVEAVGGKAAPQLGVAFSEALTESINIARRLQKGEKDIQLLPLSERGLATAKRDVVQQLVKFYGDLAPEVKRAVEAAAEIDFEFQKRQTARLLGLPTGRGKSQIDAANALEAQARSLGVAGQFAFTAFFDQAGRQIGEQSEDFADRLGSALETAIKTRLRSLLREAEAIGAEIPPRLLTGAEQAERASARADLWDRVLDAPRQAMIRLADFAAKHGQTVGEQFRGGVTGGLLRLTEDAGTFGQNINQLIVQIGAAMTRGMDDTFFNLVTGQFKKLPDLAKQMGLAIVRELTGALARFSAKSLTDLLRQLFPQTGQAIAVLLGVSGTAGGVQAIFPGLASSEGNLVPALSGGGGAGTGAAVAAGSGGAASLAGILGAGGNIVAGGFGLFTAATGGFGSNPFISGISGALSGFQFGGALFGPPGAIVGAIIGFGIGIFGGAAERRRERQRVETINRANDFFKVVDEAQSFDELDNVLSVEYLGSSNPGNRVARKNDEISTRDPHFDPKIHIGVDGNVVRHVPDLKERVVNAVTQKIARLRQEEGIPAGLVIEDVVGGIRRTAIFAGGVGGLEARLAEARSRAGTAELFFAALGDDAQMERLLKRMQKAAERIDLKITFINPFQVAGAFD